MGFPLELGTGAGVKKLEWWGYQADKATMGLSRTVSDIYGDFCRKSQNFPTPFYFASPLMGFPLELGTGAGVKKLEWWGYQADKEVRRHLKLCG